MTQNLLMRVEKSVGLTGLGILLLAQHTTPLLDSFGLYTQWRVQLAFPDGSSIEAMAGVEEISRPTETGEATIPVRALLLAQEDVEAVPAGTQVYLLTPAANF